MYKAYDDIFGIGVDVRGADAGQRGRLHALLGAHHRHRILHKPYHIHR